MADPKPKRTNTKKVVRAESKRPKASTTGGPNSTTGSAAGGPNSTTGSAAGGGATPPVWQATPEAKKKARNLRLIAGGMWLVAILLECFAIFWLLNADRRSGLADRLNKNPNESGLPTWALVLMIIVMVVMAGLAIGGSLLWKKSNDLDPASRQDTVRFFVQNQLGAIITVIAFLPLLVLILLNKDMSKQQKAIAGGVGAVLLVVAMIVGMDFDPPSVEQKTAEAQWDQQRVIAITGEDKVFWVKGGSVYHLCPEVSDLQLNSNDDTIVEGTVQDAVDNGKSRLTKKVQQEIDQCGLPQPDEKWLVNDVPAEIPDATAVEETSTAPEVTTTTAG